VLSGCRCLVVLVHMLMGCAAETSAELVCLQPLSVAHAGGGEEEEDTLDAFMRGNAPPPIRRHLSEEQEEERQERLAQQAGGSGSAQGWTICAAWCWQQPRRSYTRTA
jgi:hypothetical protein